MSTFQEKVQDLVGAQSDTAFLTDALTEGARVVVDVLSEKGSVKLDLYATDKTYTGAGGVTVTGGKAISAHKAGYPANRVPAEMYTQVLDANSIHYALATDPSWYVLKKKGYVQPSGGTLRWVAYPAVAFGDSSISNFPPEAYPAVAYYAAIQSQMRNITDLVRTTMNAITYTAPTNVTVPAGIATTHTTLDTTLTTDHDIELAGGYLSKIGALLGEYSADIQDYAAQVQEEVGRIQTLTGKFTSEYTGMVNLLKDLKEEYQRIMQTL